jgi:nitroreductase
MNLYEVITQRQSIRRYKPDPVPDEKISRILEAARLAPSACNIQPWKFLVIKSQSAKSKLHDVFQPWVLTAPIIIAGLGNKEIAWRRDGESIHSVDVAIAFEHLILAATAEGLGTCWICAFNRTAFSRALNIAPVWDPVAVTPLGYSAEYPDKRPRKDIKEIVEII